MKLSEAIREGAKRGPQCRGDFFCAGGGSCALGAAALTIGAEHAQYETDVYDRLTDEWPELEDSSGRVLKLSDLIINRNDLINWSREQIADWLAEQGL